MNRPLPLADRMLLIRDEAKKISESGVIIPEQAIERPVTGTIEAVGPDVKNLKAGDRVLFADYGGSIEINIDGKVYLLLRERDILVRFEDSNGQSPEPQPAA